MKGEVGRNEGRFLARGSTAASKWAEVRTGTAMELGYDAERMRVTSKAGSRSLGR